MAAAHAVEGQHLGIIGKQVEEYLEVAVFKPGHEPLEEQSARTGRGGEGSIQQCGIHAKNANDPHPGDPPDGDRVHR